HYLSLARVVERPLAMRKRVLQDDEDTVLADRRLCLRGTTAGRLGESPHDGPGYLGRELAADVSLVTDHRATSFSSTNAPFRARSTWVRSCVMAGWRRAS